ncbi:MAG: hypothetical protein ACOX05_01660 [Bacillota bacterium]|jgi:hypothetical protein
MIKTSRRKVAITTSVIVIGIITVLILCNKIVVTNIHNVIPYMTVEEMTAESQLVIVGTVVDKKEFKIKPVSEGAMLKCLDYYVKPTEVLRGEVNTDTVVVRVFGDYIEDAEKNTLSITRNDISLGLHLNQDYLFMLIQPGVGGSYNTKGDYYYIQNCNMGVYQKQQKTSDTYLRLLNNVDTLDMSSQELKNLEDGFMIEYSSYLGQVEKINKQRPVDPLDNKKQTIKNLEMNLENAMMTQAEFDQYIKELDMYATIIE